jgi:hypothetical protein
VRIGLITVSHFVFANQLIVNQGASCKQIFHWVREVGAENVAQGQDIPWPVKMREDYQGLNL